MREPSRLCPTSACFSILLLATSIATAEPAEAPRAVPVASYTLRTRLDTESHRVEASGQITFTNRSAVSVQELWFHLYPNAFSSVQSRFWRTTSGARRTRRSLYDSGELNVRSLKFHAENGQNLWSLVDPSTPGDPDDTTDRRVPLPHPVQPGETVVLDVDFVTQLPFIVERMGWVESFHAVAQWFPKLARLEPDGTWRHFPYEPFSEFYADFGDYDISIDVPSAFTVVAPGMTSLSRAGSGRTVARFRMASVHDFAWFAWDRFKCSRGSVASTEVEICAPPGHQSNVALERQELAFALPRYNSLFGAYPYHELVVVHPPDVAAPAGGMEYPGLIVTGAPWYAPLTGTRALSAVTVHELAHQWFYGLVATDEARYPVLDEGLASWAEVTALTDEYGVGSAFSGLGVTVSASAVAQLMGSYGYKPGPLAEPASSFATFSQLTHSVYARMALLLQTLGNIYGQDRLRAALHRYALENRFEHPGPSALVRAFRSEMGPAAANNLERALNSDGWVDFEPTRVEIAPVDADQWRAIVRIHRSGSLDFPADIAITLADGRVQAHRCTFEQPECRLELLITAPIASVTVDPRRVVAIESQCSNNTLWYSRPATPFRLIERLVYYLQLMMGGLL